LVSDNDLTLLDRLALIERAVLEWPGVTRELGRFNSTAYMLGRREIGHIHRNGVADFGFPRTIRDGLITTGRAQPHQAGIPAGVSNPIGTDEDVPRVLTLFRLSYDRLRAAAARAETTGQSSPDQVSAD
jgi:hypothetical protein